MKRLINVHELSVVVDNCSTFIEFTLLLEIYTLNNHSSTDIDERGTANRRG